MKLYFFIKLQHTGDTDLGQAVKAFESYLHSYQGFVETNMQIHSQLKNLPGCLFIRTFLLKSSYTLLRILKCLKLYAWNCMWDQDTLDFMEISSYPCNCIYMYIYNKSH